MQTSSAATTSWPASTAASAFMSDRAVWIRTSSGPNSVRSHKALPSRAERFGVEMKSTIRSFDLAHLAHIELLSPKPEESLRFFTDVMGMTESGRRGDSVYLRGWDDYEHHTLKLTASKVAGMGHVAFRATSPEALERRAAIIDAAGFGHGWTDGDLGHGRTFSFSTTDGHSMEIYYETEWYTPPQALKPALKNQAQRFPARGVNVRRLDHLNLLAADVRALRLFFEDVLGMRTTEMIVLDSGDEAGAWVTTTNKSYDLAFTADHYGARGRVHHLTYAVDSREDVLRAADIFLENGVYIETGPHKHAIQQTFFLYGYEPGGNRVAIDSAGARRGVGNTTVFVTQGGVVLVDTKLPNNGDEPPRFLSLPELHRHAALDAARHTGDGDAVGGEFPRKVPRLRVGELPIHPTVFHGEAP